MCESAYVCTCAVSSLMRCASFALLSRVLSSYAHTNTHHITVSFKVRRSTNAHIDSFISPIECTCVSIHASMSMHASTHNTTPLHHNPTPHANSSTHQLGSQTFDFGSHSCYFLAAVRACVRASIHVPVQRTRVGVCLCVPRSILMWCRVVLRRACTHIREFEHVRNACARTHERIHLVESMHVCTNMVCTLVVCECTNMGM